MAFQDLRTIINGRHEILIFFFFSMQIYRIYYFLFHTNMIPQLHRISFAYIAFLWHLINFRFLASGQFVGILWSYISYATLSLYGLTNCRKKSKPHQQTISGQNTFPKFGSTLISDLASLLLSVYLSTNFLWVMPSVYLSIAKLYLLAKVIWARVHFRCWSLRAY